jgi:hypothetical protein
VGSEGMIPIKARDAMLLVALALALVLGTCVLPFWFPPRDFVVGASYELGFNNAISFFAYIAALSLVVVVLARLLPAPSHDIADGLHWKASRFSYRVAAAVIGAHVMLFSALYAYKGRFVFAEGLYFQSLLHRMLQGEVPYTDFGFYYGPLMLYPAYWLSTIVGLDAGYAIWYVATYVVGLVFLFGVLSICMDTPRNAALWFVFLALGLFNPLTGLNITFTRYLFPSVVFLVVVQFFRDGGIRRGVVAAATLAAATTYTFEVAALSLAATLLIWIAFAAPSIGSAVAGSLGRLIPAEQRTRSTDAQVGRVSTVSLILRGAGLLALATAFCVGAFLFLDPSGSALRDYPEIARSYSGGAHNVPIYPHLPYLALVIISAVALAAVLRIVAARQHGTMGMAALAYAAVAIVAQRAAFGAAEPSHFAYFGLPVFLIALVAATRFAASTRSHAWLAGLLLVGIMLPMQYYHFTEFLPFVAARLQATPSTNAAGTVEPASGENLETALRDVVRTLGRERPYVMYEMEYNSLPVYRDFGLRYPMYWTMLITARDHEGIRRAIHEVRDRNAIVVVRKNDLRGLSRPRESGRVSRLLDLATGAHTGGSGLNEVLLKSRSELTRPFLQFLERGCIRLYEDRGLVAFAPN